MIVRTPNGEGGMPGEHAPFAAFSGVAQPLHPRRITRSGATAQPDHRTHPTVGTADRRRRAVTALLLRRPAACRQGTVVPRRPTKNR